MIKICKKVVEIGCLEGFNWTTIMTIEDANEVSEYVQEAHKDTTRFYYGTYFSKRLGCFQISHIILGDIDDEILDKLINKGE